MSASQTLNVKLQEQDSKPTSFDTRRTSSTSNASSEGHAKPDGSFKRMAKKVANHAKEHHRSVKAAHRAYYGGI